MTNNFRMSYFMPPIAPIRNEQGQTVTPATLTPFCEVSVEQVYQMITCNENLKALTEQVRGAGDLRMAKASLLPYVTPCGTFIRRSSKFFASPSGLIVVDIDNLDSYQKAVEMRRTLFDDLFLCPILTFISPSGRGVKAFVKHKLGNAIHRNNLRIRNGRLHRNSAKSRRHLRQRHRKSLFPQPRPTSTIQRVLNYNHE